VNRNEYTPWRAVLLNVLFGLSKRRENPESLTKDRRWYNLHNNFRRFNDLLFGRVIIIILAVPELNRQVLFTEVELAFDRG